MKAPKPVCPLTAGPDELQGHVAASLMIDENGNVEEAKATSDKPPLARAVEDAFRQWKFKPYIKDGKPAKTHTEVPFDFYFAAHGTDSAGSAAKTNTAAVGKEGDRTPSNNSPTTGLRKLCVPEPGGKGMLIHRVEPEYPMQARRSRTQGTVLLDITINRKGLVQEIRFISGDPILARAAVDAVAQRRYKTFYLNDDPIDTDTRVKITYSVR